MTPKEIIQRLAEKAQEHRQNISSATKQNQTFLLEEGQYSDVLTAVRYMATQDYVATRLAKIADELLIMSDIPDLFPKTLESIKHYEVYSLVNEVKSGNLSHYATGKAIVVEILNNIGSRWNNV